MGASGNTEDQTQRLLRLERRCRREHLARLAAEELLETKARALYMLNQELRELAEQLEARVNERTQQLQEARDEAINEANHDALTGLFNRRRHESLLQEAIDAAAAGGVRVALLMLDLDNFKEINDRFGHDAGDGVLRHVAALLRAELGAASVIARLGGDEFSVIAPLGCEEDEILALSERVHRCLATPYPYGEFALPIAGSAGIALFPDHGHTTRSLLRNADIALYRSKMAGRNMMTVYDPSMYEEIVRRQELTAELKNSALEQSLEPWLQPIVDAVSGRTVGLEALVRWRRADGDIAPPAVFLDLARQCGLLYRIFRIMLDRSLENTRRLVLSGAVRYVSVNVSASDFCEDIVGEVIAALSRHDYPAEALVLEITEEAVIADTARAELLIRQLRAHGVGVALDDFGSGYANVGYLSALDISMLKLDRSLTRNVVGDAKARIIVSALADMAGALGLFLIGEGVETDAQVRTLSLCGCTTMQGFHFAKPLPPDALEAFLAHQAMAI